MAALSSQDTSLLGIIPKLSSSGSLDISKATPPLKMQTHRPMAVNLYKQAKSAGKILVSVKQAQPSASLIFQSQDHDEKGEIELIGKPRQDITNPLFSWETPCESSTAYTFYFSKTCTSSLGNESLRQRLSSSTLASDYGDMQSDFSESGSPAVAGAGSSESGLKKACQIVKPLNCEALPLVTNKRSSKIKKPRGFYHRKSA
jgi:hypothetical protein